MPGTITSVVPAGITCQGVAGPSLKGSVDTETISAYLGSVQKKPFQRAISVSEAQEASAGLIPGHTLRQKMPGRGSRQYGRPPKFRPAPS